VKIIQSATFRLTLSYLAVIMVLSIAFSSLLYQVSSDELTRSLRRPLPQGFYTTGPTAIDQFREQQLKEGIEHLQANLFLLNMLTLIAGGAVSYALARWTLRPVEQTMQAQGRFAADASHELRTPLTAMQTEIEVALRDPKLSSAESKALLQSNLEEIAKLKALSDGLLKLTQSDRAELRLKPVDLSDTAREAVERLGKVATKRSITLDSQLNAVKTLGERASLIELITVLIDNAIKYSPAKSKVIIATDKVGKQAVLQVRDEGQGIKASDQPHIFERFYRADRSRSKEVIEGYGLGLSIAHQIVTLHKGTIEVHSEIGKGAIFTVKLPSF
jgi:signal transduction histidine kinase